MTIHSKMTEDHQRVKGSIIKFISDLDSQGSLCVLRVLSTLKISFLIQSIYVLVRWSHSWWTFFVTRRKTNIICSQSIENWDKIPFCAYFGLVFPDQVDYFSSKTLPLMKFQIYNQILKIRLMMNQSFLTAGRSLTLNVFVLTAAIMKALY